MWKKLASIAALFSSAAALSACQTAAGKPVECLPRFVMAGRCAKVPAIKTRTVIAPTVKKKVVKPRTSITEVRPAAPQHVFSQPTPKFIPPSKRDNGYTN